MGREQVPMTAGVESRVTMHYRLEDPGRIAVFSRAGLAIAAILAVVLLAVGVI